MKKLLITGFEPFGGESINPSWEAVSRLPDVIGEYELTKVRLPVVFGLAAERALEVAKELSPDVILCIGQTRTVIARSTFRRRFTARWQVRPRRNLIQYVFVFCIRSNRPFVHAHIFICRSIFVCCVFLHAAVTWERFCKCVGCNSNRNHRC